MIFYGGLKSPTIIKTHGSVCRIKKKNFMHNTQNTQNTHTQIVHILSLAEELARDEAQFVYFEGSLRTQKKKKNEKKS